MTADEYRAWVKSQTEQERAQREAKVGIFGLVFVVVGLFFVAWLLAGCDNSSGVVTPCTDPAGCATPTPPVPFPVGLCPLFPTFSYPFSNHPDIIQIGVTPEGPAFIFIDGVNTPIAPGGYVQVTLTGGPHSITACRACGCSVPVTVII